jgi:MFS family permease
MPPREPVTMSSPFAWLVEGFATLRRAPRVAFGGFAWIALVALVPSFVQALVNLFVPGNLGATVALIALGTLYGTLVTPPVFAAGFRLMHRLHTGAPAQAGDVLAVWSDRDYVRRIIQLSVLLMLVYLLLAVLFWLALPGKEFWTELFRRTLDVPPGGQPDLHGMPPFPPSTFLWVLALGFTLFVLSNAWFLATVRAALDRRGPVEAAVEGFLATLRNFLPLFGFALVAMVGFCVLGMVIGMLFAFAGVIAGLISPRLVELTVLPINFVIALGMYAVLFGFYYHAWRQLFADGSAPAGGDDAIVV